MNETSTARLKLALSVLGLGFLEQLAEYLADLGRGDKVALPSEHVASHVVPVHRVRQGGTHKLGYGERAAEANA